MAEIFFSLGDISSDRIASYLIPVLRRLNRGLRISGVGGSGLRSVSDIFLGDIVQRSSFGFVEPVKDYFYFRQMLKKIVSYWKNNLQVKKIVLMDFYGFNIHLAKQARMLGRQVIYYISPQVWASREKRIRKIKKYVQKMLVIFPFEQDFYRRHNFLVEYVGHPLTKIIQPENNPKEENTVGLFPGSRLPVIKRHWPLLKKTMEILFAQNKNRKFYYFGPELESTDLPLTIVSPELSNQVRKKILVAICPSGTVALENVFYDTAMIVYYRLSPLTYFLARKMVKVKHIAMPNIILQEAVVPEFIQVRATPEKIAEAANNLLTDSRARLTQLNNFTKIKNYLKTEENPLLTAAKKISE